MDDLKYYLIEYYKLVCENTDEILSEDFIKYINSVHKKELESIAEISEKINLSFKEVLNKKKGGKTKKKKTKKKKNKNKKIYTHKKNKSKGKRKSKKLMKGRM